MNMALGTTGRFALRLTVVAALAGLAALRAALGDGSFDSGEVVEVLEATLGAAAVYAGIGYASENVEPHIGNTLDQ
jgi:hypothetical protein